MADRINLFFKDAYLKPFRESKIPGEAVIWHEKLTEGPLHPEFGSDAFWRLRYDFFKSEYGTQKLDYFDHTIKEMIRLQNLEKESEVSLWFPKNHFGLVNFLGAGSYLLKYYRKDLRFYIISIPESKDPVLTTETLLKAYEHKIKISRNDLLFIDRAWKTYVKGRNLTLFDFSTHKKLRFFENLKNPVSTPKT